MDEKNNNFIDFKGLGYESARNILPHTVKTGREVEEALYLLLSKLGYVEGKDYQTQKEVKYSLVNDRATIREDIVIPSFSKPSTIITATHSNPTIPGHSNENKLHQAIGELFLLKTFNSSLRNIIFIGGKKENWLSYVLDTIHFFYDATVYTWDSNPLVALKNALSCPLKHSDFWQQEKSIRDTYVLSEDANCAPDANLRTNFFRNVVGQYLGRVNSISEIDNSILKRMMEISVEKSNGRLWIFLKEGKSNDFYQERTIFNPAEIIVDMMLENKGFHFKSEIRDGFDKLIVTPNLLYDLGHLNSHRRTDFILDTKDGKKVLIECKSAGGGEGGHLTKHITDRAREQVARSIFHRCSVINGKPISKRKDFYWYYLLDAKWRTPRAYPLKYVHLLEMSGVNAYYSCDDLVDSDFEPNYDFPLLAELSRIGCK